jgi:hypothetical protein
MNHSIIVITFIDYDNKLPFLYLNKIYYNSIN